MMGEIEGVRHDDESDDHCEGALIDVGVRPGRSRVGTTLPWGLLGALVLVVVTESRKMTVPIIVKPIGTTRALEEVTIRARVRGFLTEKYFEYGTNVKKNQPLLVIDERPFKVQLAEAKAQLESAVASLKKANASKAREVAKAQLELSQAQARLDTIEERRERNLLLRKAASQDDYDRAEAQKGKRDRKSVV